MIFTYHKLATCYAQDARGKTLVFNIILFTDCLYPSSMVKVNGKMGHFFRENINKSYKLSHSGNL